MRTKSHWPLERTTKFRSGSRIWRFKGISGITGPKFNHRYRKCTFNFLQKIKSDLRSFHRMLSARQFYQCGDPSAFSLFSSHSFAWKLSLKVWGSTFPSSRGLAGRGAPEGQGVESVIALLQQEPRLRWQSPENLVGWRSSVVSSGMPGVRDAWLRCYRVPLKSKQRADADRREQLCF